MISLKLGTGLTGVVGSQGAVWTPSTLATNKGYWVVRLGHIWKDAAGTVPAAVATDPIRRIDDLSGNGNHLIAPSDPERGLLAIVGGKLVVRCDGATTNYKAANVALGQAKLTMTSAASTAIIPTFIEFPYTISFNPGNNGLRLGFASSKPEVLGGAVNTTTSPTALIINTPYTLTGRVSTTILDLRVNGVVVATGVPISPGATTADCFMASRGDPLFWWNGDIYGGAIYGDTLSDADAALNDAFMASLYS